jgi:TorA maturation chaperone TorD
MGRGEIGRGDQAEARARLYELLALGFSPPSEELVKVLEEGETLFPWLDQEEVRALQAFPSEELIPEYHRLFVGPGGLPAPPYESVYREDWRVMGESTVDVTRQYAEAGYALAPSFNDLPDHVAAELGFMSLLCEEEAQAWRAAREEVALALLRREERFLGDHLAVWLPPFCDRVAVAAEREFYRVLAKLARAYVLLDRERVTMLLRTLEASKVALWATAG